MSKLLTEDEVKAKLGIPDFRSINKQQVIELVSSIPDMGKETAIKCIEQFPNFKELSGNIIEHFLSICDSVIQNDGDESFIAYQRTLDDLDWMLRKDDLSDDMRKFVVEKMVEVGDKIDRAVDKKRDFKEIVLKIGGTIAVVAVAAASTLLGGKVKLPINKDL